MRPSNRDTAARSPAFHLDTGPQGQGPRKQPQGALPTASPGSERPGAAAPPSHGTCCPATGAQTQAASDWDEASETRRGRWGSCCARHLPWAVCTVGPRPCRAGLSGAEPQPLMAEHAWRGVTTPGRPQLCRSGCGLRLPVASASVSPQRSLTGGCAEAGSQHGSPWLGSRGRAERVLPPPGPGWPGASMHTLEVGRGRAERRWLPRQRRRCLGLRAARPHTRPGPGSPQCGHAPAAAPSRRHPRTHTHTERPRGPGPSPRP